MAHLFDTISVREDNGPWTRGPYPRQYPERAFQSQLVDICNPAFPIEEGPEVPFGENVSPFAVVGYMKTPTRCEPDEFEQIAQTAMANSTAHIISKVLWHGTDQVADFREYLTHEDITTVPREATHLETIAAVVAKGYEKTPQLTPLLHIGHEIALTMGIGLRNIGLPYVIGSAYPPDAIAVTDLYVAVSLTKVDATNAVDTRINRRQVELTRFAAIEFDYFKAVRAEDTP